MIHCLTLNPSDHALLDLILIDLERRCQVLVGCA